MYSIFKSCFLILAISSLATIHTYAEATLPPVNTLIQPTEVRHLIPTNPKEKTHNFIEKDTSKTIAFRFNIHNIPYHFILFLKNTDILQEFNAFKMAHPDSSNHEIFKTFQSVYTCDTISYSPVNTFSIAFANHIRDKGRFSIHPGDTTIDYSQKWVSTDIKNSNTTTLIQLIDINRDGKTDVLLNDIENENMANALTNFWIFNTQKGLPEFIPTLTKPIWGIEIGQHKTYLKTGWRIDRNRKNERTFYLIGINENHQPK